MGGEIQKDEADGFMNKECQKCHEPMEFCECLPSLEAPTFKTLCAQLDDLHKSVSRIKAERDALKAEVGGLQKELLETAEKLTDQTWKNDELRAQMAWRDIASAPRDGSAILVYGDNYEGGKSFGICHWVKSEFSMWEQVSEKRKELVSKDDSNWSDDYYGSPTHWRPLPQPPHDPLSIEARHMDDDAMPKYVGPGDGE